MSQGTRPIVVVATLVAALIAGKSTSASAQVIDPEQWYGEWDGVLVSKSVPDCAEGGRYKTNKLRVRLRIIPGPNGGVTIDSSGLAMPWLLPAGDYPARSAGGGLLVRDDAPSTVALARQGLTLRYSGVLDTSCGGTENGILRRRPTSGIVACDQLASIHFAHLLCSQSTVTESVYPDLQRIGKMKGAAKARQTRACEASLSVTKAAMIQAGCLPVAFLDTTAPVVTNAAPARNLDALNSARQELAKWGAYAAALVSQKTGGTFAQPPNLDAPFKSETVSEYLSIRSALEAFRANLTILGATAPCDSVKAYNMFSLWTESGAAAIQVNAPAEPLNWGSWDGRSAATWQCPK